MLASDSLAVCSVIMTLDNAVSSPVLSKADFAGATNYHATNCRIELYDITTRWYIGNLIFIQRQIILQQILSGAF